MLISDLHQVKHLNRLVVLNNDRLEGYGLACEKSKASVLKALFSGLTETSAICRQDLINEIYKLGGIPKLEAHIGGEFSLAWSYVKDALDRDDHKLLLNSCYYEEEVAVNTYKETLSQAGDALTRSQRNMMNKHYEILYGDHERIKNLLKIVSDQ